jgi:hypothetical protein
VSIIMATSMHWSYVILMFAVLRSVDQLLVVQGGRDMRFSLDRLASMSLLPES